ncbi:MAG TPA: hypothetical protein VFS63_04565 [Pseudolabrys sp.]|nr:hypothetical protein [Pseudolabrys sp.]
MDEAAIARAVHVAAVVIWIGGVAMVTTVLLPIVRRKDEPIEKRLALFESIESRFVWQARVATVLVALSGFYMVDRYDLWSRFSSVEFWWMHAMVGVWLLFTLLLFIAEPLIVHRWIRRQALSGNERVLAVLYWMHWVLLSLSLATVLAAVAGSHGMSLVP